MVMAFIPGLVYEQKTQFNLTTHYHQFLDWKTDEYSNPYCRYCRE